MKVGAGVAVAVGATVARARLGVAVGALVGEAGGVAVEAAGNAAVGEVTGASGVAWVVVRDGIAVTTIADAVATGNGAAGATDPQATSRMMTTSQAAPNRLGFCRNTHKLQASALPGHGHRLGRQLLRFGDERIDLARPSRCQLAILQTRAVDLHV